MPDHDAELDALAAQLSEAGYLTIVKRPDGGVSYQLTEDGAQVARQLAMSGQGMDRASSPPALLGMTPQR
jgi:DNA-binding PadR family transcriptional regulator